MTTMVMATILLFLVSLSYVLQSTAAVNFIPVGCYKDKGVKSRTLPVLVHNYRSPRGQPEFDWYNLNKTIEACAREVQKRGFIYFGIQFYGECWSGPEGHVTYDFGGPSESCIKGVGTSWTNFVYRLAGEENECMTYKELNTGDRAQTTAGGHKCDHTFWNFEHRWYRFVGAAGTAMANTCVQPKHCGTQIPGWLRGPHPNVTAGIQDGTTCFNEGGNCCKYNYNAKVRNCGHYYVYKLSEVSRCYSRYCGNGTDEYSLVVIVGEIED